ncbi:High-affinity branched-chain amino acid transport ATP-binding protein LivF [Streptomyces xanthophaeus]|uniref:ABC transporter ATP-binding protein n=1 Tax=Streptomyces xanthophaeus TaxID=67385 RepID=UPI00233ECC0A|nr:ABC transporter ATP-binding protein [Streptomyces xanthophaeus]WCD90077.1 High-affinity branched-chain amino acid transport ATP-binding protein LivF [Streptomyces xanthophaeus]
MKPFFSIRGLSSGYAGGVVLGGVDLDLDEGGIVAVLGRNGVGKTTLISTVMGLVRPYEGSVTLGGRELAGCRVDVIARAGVGVVPQGRRVFAPLTVAEHLAIAARRPARGPWTRARILDLLPRLGERLGHRGDQLSGGEQQMLAIARALLGNPSLLLLDEPSDGLAPAVVAQVGEVIREVGAQGMSVVLVEQNLGLAFSVAQDVAVMQKGRIVHEAACADFRSSPEDRRRLLGVD